jgi:hypothetical protein
VPASLNVVLAANADSNPAQAKVITGFTDNDHIAVITAPHLVNTTTVSVDNLWEKTSYASFSYYPTVFVSDGAWSEYLNWEDHSSENILPYPHSVIHIKANCSQDVSVDMDSMTVDPRKSYRVESGKTLKSNVFTLLDNASFLNDGTDQIATARVLHRLAKARNWYVSSPTQGGILPTVDPALTKDESGNSLTSGRVEWYDEPVHAWKPAGGAFITGMGYTAWSANEDIAVNFSGKFTDGNASAPVLTRQNDAHPKRGFNLVGNPFPSYWRWTSATAQNANVYSTVWYRTNVGTPPTYNDYRFWAYNASGNVSVAPGWDDATQTAPYSLSYIPPMQAFWVRLRDGASSGTLTFSNADRRHADLGSNLLKAASEDSRPLLRLSLSEGSRRDETLIYADTSAESGFDDFDSDKWLTGEGAELFTLPASSKRELMINGFPAITAGMEIPLGFQADRSGVFTVCATEIQNLDTLNILLRDKWLYQEMDLRNGGSYSFTSGGDRNIDRFSIAFAHRKTGLADGDSAGSFVAYGNKAGQLIVELHVPKLQGANATVTVFDITGRKLTRQTIAVGERTVLKGLFGKGVYVLQANQWTVKAVAGQ